MINPISGRPTWALVISVLACLTAAWAAGKVLDRHGEADRDLREVKLMTARVKTVCVGRLLIDMPLDAQISLHRIRIDGLDVATFAQSRDAFLADLANRQQQIESTPDRHGGQRNMESMRDLITRSGLEGKIFMHGRAVTEGSRPTGPAADQVEHFRYENISIEAMVHAHWLTIQLSATDYDPDLADNLTHLVERAVVNPDGDIPTVPGFCVDRAYFGDPANPGRVETIVMSARLPAHPDVDFTMIVMGGLASNNEGPLARRTNSSLLSTLLASLRLSTLRAAPRDIAGMPGEEVAERVTEQNDTVGYSFDWAVNGAGDDLTTPSIFLLMMTGNGDHAPVQSSLTEDAALALWDKVVSSIRRHSVTAAPVISSIGPLAAASMRQDGTGPLSAGVQEENR